MGIAENLSNFKRELGAGVALVAVSKYSDNDAVQAAYDAGHRDFGENKVQDICAKQEALPTDIHWHFIGHLQRNKVRFLAPFVHLIHACDSLRLLREIDKQAKNNNRVISCLFQLKIAAETEKFGLDPNEIIDILKGDDFKLLENVRISGLMAMATNTDDVAQLNREFGSAKALFEELRKQDLGPRVSMETLSMGMSQDYRIAIDHGSNMIRVGSAIFKT